MSVPTPDAGLLADEQPPPVVEIRDVTKTFGATRALDNARLTIRLGRVHALLGENGAGKSTLVRIIVGATQTDAGTYLLDGKPAAFHSVREAFAAGIVPIYQNLSLFPHLSVLENLSAFALGATRSISATPVLMHPDEATKLLAMVGLAADLHSPVTSLTLGERQLLEIARGIGRDCRVLVLDEPTASLSTHETERLFDTIRRLCARGTAIVFISHKLDEIEALADDVTILRDGKTVLDGQPLRSLTRGDLIRMMIGGTADREVGALHEPKDVIVRVRGLSIHAQSTPVDIDIRQGEILGFAGLVGSGALELASALAGARQVATGTIAIGPQFVRAGDRAAAMKAGIGYVPSDRLIEGLFLLLSATENASASIMGGLTTAGFLRRRVQESKVQPWLSRLNLNPFKLDQPAGNFSGGNQQKLIVCRNLSLDPLKLLVLLEPTRGVDVGARDTIHQAIVEAAHSGVAVLLASTDIDEVVTLCHRVHPVWQGTLGPPLERGFVRDDLMRRLTGRA